MEINDEFVYAKKQQQQIETFVTKIFQNKPIHLHIME